MTSDPPPPVAPRAASGRRLARDLTPIAALLSSNVLGTVAAGVFFLVALTRFEPDVMGRYGVAIGIQWVLVGLLGSGVSVAVIRLGADAIESGDRPAAAGLVAAGFAITAGVGVAAAVVARAAGGVLTAGGLDGATLAWVALWGGGRSALDSVRSGLLVERRYRAAAALMVVSAATGLAALAWAVLAAPLDLDRLLAAHAVGLGSAAVLGLAFLRPLVSEGVRVERAAVGALIGYARWPSISEGARMLQANLGVFLLSALAGEAEAGLFTVGRYPAYLFEVVAISLYQYWLPEASRRRDPDRLAGFLAVQARLALAVGALMVVAAFAARPLLPWIAPAYAAAGLLFVLSTLDFALVLLARPIESVFHGMRRPRLEFALRVARLPVLAGLGVLWLRSDGAVGMAWAYVASGVAVLALAVGLVRRALNRPAGAPSRPPVPASRPVRGETPDP